MVGSHFPVMDYFSIILLLLLRLSLTYANPFTHRNLHSLASTTNMSLRILPLGDSLTFGERSTDGNGYRLHLSNLLTNTSSTSATSNTTLSYIGSVESGTMHDNHHEGHGGYQIVPVGLTGKPDYALRPNLVLLLAGTNDIVFDVDVENAPTRLGDLAKEITEECPDSSVLVGTMIPLLNPGWAPKVTLFNDKLTQIIASMAGNDKKVAIVNMSRVNTTHIHTDDGIHPTDEGYEKIAEAWYDGIMEAQGKGWIEKPVATGTQDQIDNVGEEPKHPVDLVTAPSSKETKAPLPHTRHKDVEKPSMNSTAYNNRYFIYAVILFGMTWYARKALGWFWRRYGT